MNDELTDHLRVREGDVLQELLADLTRQALHLKPYDGDARAAFLAAVKQLLAAVPDRYQRMAWSIQLSTACTLGMQLQGIPAEFSLAQLWERET